MQRVEIHVKGHLDKNWTEWLEGFTLTLDDNDETILMGMVEDQSALYGLMAKLRDMGVKLSAVEYRAVEDGSLSEDKYS